LPPRSDELWQNLRMTTHKKKDSSITGGATKQTNNLYAWHLVSWIIEVYNDVTKP